MPEYPPQKSRPDQSISNRHLWQIQPLRDVVVIVGVIALVWFGYKLQSVTVPLLLALTLAYLMEPLVVKLSRHPKISRPMVVGGMIGLFAIGFLAILAMLPLFVMQASEFSKSLPGTFDQVMLKAEEVIQSIEEQMQESSDDSEVGTPDVPPDEVAASQESEALSQVEESSDGGEEFRKRITVWGRENLGAIFDTAMKTSGGAVSMLGGMVGALIYIVFALFLVPFYFFFMSTGWGKLMAYIADLFPEEHTPQVYDLARKMDSAVSGFVRGRIVISVIMGVMLSVGWAFCGVPYWLIIGMATGVLCAVPYLGVVGLPLAIIFLAIQPGDPAPVWWAVLLFPTIVFVVVQLIEGYFLTPVIAGKATNLGTVSILVAVLAGGAVMGMYGMLLAIPLAACLKILITDLFIPRVRDWAEGRARDILPINHD